MPRWGTETASQIFSISDCLNINFDYAPMGDGNDASIFDAVNDFPINFDYAPMGDGN